MKGFRTIGQLDILEGEIIAGNHRIGRAGAGDLLDGLFA